MPLEGEYEPGTWKDWARTQVETYEASGGTKANSTMGVPIVVVTMLGAKTAKLRKVALMRVEHDGTYLLVASKGGSHEQPKWYFNLLANPHVELQDGPEKHDYVARELEGDERETWWARAVGVYGPYAGYQKKTDRLIPVFLLTPIAP